MQTEFAPVPALHLTEEEAFGLLDLCLMSSTELDDCKTMAMEKLTGLVRFYVAHSLEAPEPDADDLSEEESIPMTEVIACIEANEEDAIAAVVENAMRDHSGRVCFRSLLANR